MSWSSRPGVVPGGVEVGPMIFDQVAFATAVAAPFDESAVLPDDGTCAQPAAVAGSEGDPVDQRIEAARQDGYESGRIAGREEGRAEGHQVGAEEGRRVGYVEGVESERARLAGAFRAAEAAFASALAGEEKWAGVLDENLYALAVAVAAQLIGREVRSDPGVVQDLVQSALSHFPIAEPVRVRMHPDDLECVPASDADVARPVVWLADEAMIRGGCLVEGRERIVDGRIDVGLETLYRRLIGVVGDHG